MTRLLLFIFFLSTTPINQQKSFPHNQVKLKQVFSARFYDETGSFVGSIGTIDNATPIYIVATKTLFQKRFFWQRPKITPENIVKRVGTEVIYDRQTPVLELKANTAVFKLPPKEHRDSIKQIIEQTHFQIDSVDYEMGGCGYHNNAGQFLHLRAVDGKKALKNQNPSVELFNAVDFDAKVDSFHQLITSGNSRIIAEKRIEYTWHTHPPKVNRAAFQQMPSIHDFNFGNSYPTIKQHFLISLKYKTVYYYGFGMHLPKERQSSETGAFNFQMRYETFFGLN